MEKRIEYFRGYTENTTAHNMAKVGRKKVASAVVPISFDSSRPTNISFLYLPSAVGFSVGLLSGGMFIEYKPIAKAFTLGETIEIK